MRALLTAAVAPHHVGPAAPCCGRSRAGFLHGGVVRAPPPTMQFPTRWGPIRVPIRSPLHGVRAPPPAAGDGGYVVPGGVGSIAGEDGSPAGPIVAVDQLILCKLKEGTSDDELDQLFRNICVIRNKIHESWEDRKGGSELQQQVFDGVQEISVGRTLANPEGAPGPPKYWDFVLHIRYASPVAARQFWLTPAWKNITGEDAAVGGWGCWKDMVEREEALEFESPLLGDGVPQFEVGAARAVLFRLKDDADPEAEAAAIQGLLSHSGDIPGCREVTTGRAVPLQLVAGGGWTGAGAAGGGEVGAPHTHGFLARFDSDEDLVAYLSNPTHMEVMKGLFPLLDKEGPGAAAVDANWAPLDDSLRFI